MRKSDTRKVGRGRRTEEQEEEKGEEKVKKVREEREKDQTHNRIQKRGTRKEGKSS